jgi:hypothetical protein
MEGKKAVGGAAKKPIRFQAWLFFVAAKRPKF